MFKNWIPATLSAVALTLGSAAAQAQYSVSVQNASVFGNSGNPSSSYSTSGNTFGVNWSVPGSVNVFGVGTTSTLTFDLPAFTLTADPGYVLGGPVTLSIGTFTFTALNGAEWGDQFEGTLSVNGGPGTPVFALLAGPTTVSAPGYLGGNLDASYSMPLASGASTIQFSGGVLSLSAYAGGNSSQFANILPTGQTQFSVSFTAAPVPEPESYAMLAAGLFLIGSIVRRRRA